MIIAPWRRHEVDSTIEMVSEKWGVRMEVVKYTLLQSPNYPPEIEIDEPEFCYGVRLSGLNLLETLIASYLDRETALAVGGFLFGTTCLFLDVGSGGLVNEM